MFAEFFGSLIVALSVIPSFITYTVAIWVFWRIWTFTVKPFLNPREPREVPYAIPILGHMVPFFKDSDAVFTKSREYFGDVREPFAITVMGQRIYVVTAPHDVTAVYRNLTTLTFDEFVKDMMESLGTTKEGMKKAWGPWDNSLRKGQPITAALPHRAEEIYRTQLLPGKKFEALWTSIEIEIGRALEWHRIPMQAVLTDGRNEKKLSLWKFCRHGLVETVTTAIFGSKLLEIEPNLTEIFAAFNDNSWKLTYKLPPSVAKEMHDAKAKLRIVFEKYIDLPAKEKSDAAWLVETLLQEMRRYEMPARDIAILFLMPMWVINSNAYKLCFWLLAHLVHNPDLYSTIRAETARAYHPADEGADRQKIKGLGERILGRCPRLVALYYELLRLNTASASIRGIATDTEIGAWKLRAGNKVMVPYRQLHMNKAAWGADAERFVPERFFVAEEVEKKNPTKSPSFRPFGGGSTYCAGTHIAIREVLTFVVIAIHGLNIRLDSDRLESGGTQLVEGMVDHAMPSLGVLPPYKGREVEVLISKPNTIPIYE